MEQEFTPGQQALILETLARREAALIQQVVEAVAQTEADANAEFAQNGITFAAHSPANANYLSAVLLGALFDRLHRGDRDVGAWILTMEAKRLGISLQVD